MAIDNVILSPNSGNGATMRAFADASSIEWPSAVVCYASTVSPGANVLQAVTGSTGLPVAQQGTWNVQSTLQAGTAMVGQISASHETSTIFSGTTAITPQFALITASASGPTTIVAATGGKRIRVLRWTLSANGNVNAKWQSHTTPTDLTGLHYMTQYGSAGGAYCPQGIFQTNIGEALDLNLSAAVAVGGELTFILV